MNFRPTHDSFSEEQTSTARKFADAIDASDTLAFEMVKAVRKTIGLKNLNAPENVQIFEMAVSQVINVFERQDNVNTIDICNNIRDEIEDRQDHMAKIPKFKSIRSDDTWCGRGRWPHWLKEESQRRNLGLDAFLMKEKDFISMFPELEWNETFETRLAQILTVEEANTLGVRQDLIEREQRHINQAYWPSDREKLKDTLCDYAQMHGSAIEFAKHPSSYLEKAVESRMLVEIANEIGWGLVREWPKDPDHLKETVSRFASCYDSLDDFLEDRTKAAKCAIENRLISDIAFEVFDGFERPGPR